MEDEKELYKKFLDGDKKAFEKLILNNKNNVIYFITRYVKNIELAEDIFQDVMIFILENKDYYKFEYSFKTYIYMIAKSKALDFIKKEKNIESLDDSKIEIEDTKLLEEIVLTKERQNKIKDVISKMPYEYQMVIYLTQIEGLSYKETALIMDETEKKIKALTFRARKKLKKLLVEEKVIEIRNNRMIILVSVLLFISAVFTGITYADEIREFIKSIFGPNSSDGVDTAINNGFISKSNSEMLKNEELQIDIESFMMDDYNFGINFKVFINGESPKALKKIEFIDLYIVDEENNIVFNTDSVELENKEMLNKSYKGGYSFSSKLLDNNSYIVSLFATGGWEPFPRSKKIIASFKKIKIIDIDGNEIIKDGDWKFETDVPKEMYDRETIIYKVKSCNDNKTIVNDAMLSNTAFKISIPETSTDKIDYKALYDRENRKSINSLIALQKEYVETSDGKKFEITKKGDSGYGGSPDENKIIDYHQTFNLTKYDATDTLTVHIFTNAGKEIIIEYEKIK